MKSTKYCVFVGRFFSSFFFFILENQHVFTAIPYEQPLSLKLVIFDCQKSNSLASANFCNYKGRYFTLKSKQVQTSGKI